MKPLVIVSVFLLLFVGCNTKPYCMKTLHNNLGDTLYVVCAEYYTWDGQVVWNTIGEYKSKTIADSMCRELIQKRKDAEDREFK
jgi:hypothetical protein